MSNTPTSTHTSGQTMVPDDLSTLHSDSAPADSSTSIGLAVFVARMLLGFTFLWAFVDKLFGLGFSTPSSNAWIDGGSPTNGFLSHVAVGPFESLFHSLAGNVIVDWLFMVGLLGIGLALVAGVALRVMAISGSVMMVMMWFADFPPAKFDSTGTATSSVNPFVDYHLIYAIAMIMIAALATSVVQWSLADRWQKIPVVARNRWLW